MGAHYGSAETETGDIAGRIRAILVEDIRDTGGYKLDGKSAYGNFSLEPLYCLDRCALSPAGR